MLLNDKVKDLVEAEIKKFIEFYSENNTREKSQMLDDLKIYLKDFEYKPDRINEIEERAWLNMSGEDVENTLRSIDEPLYEEYIELFEHGD